MAVSTIETHAMQRSGFLINAHNTDWSTAEIVVAAGVTGEKIHLAWVHIFSALALVVTLGDAEAANVISRKTLGPFFSGNNADRFIRFPNPVVFTLDAPLIAATTAAVEMTILACGWYSV